MEKHPHQPRFLRYQWVYKALMDAGVPIIALKPKSKRPAFGTVLESRIRDLDHLEVVLDDLGLNIGAVTHQKDLPGTNPLGFVELDIDKAGHGCDLSQFPLMVRRNGQSDRAHFPFRVPNPQEPIRASLHGTHDVCTWNTVLAGSIHEDGSLYELWIKDGNGWVLWDGEAFAVEMLPIIDPDTFRTSGEPGDGVLESGSSSVNGNKLAQALHPRKPIPIWVTASGRDEIRYDKAKYYVRGCAWKATEGNRGHSALYAVVCNLRLYHQLPFSRALYLLNQYFNPRCRDQQGRPCPWSGDEILHKWEQAGLPGAYPTLGVKDPKARRKEELLQLQGEVIDFLERFTTEGGSCSPTSLLEAFRGFRGGEPISAKTFGALIRSVTGNGSKSPGGPRRYLGFHLKEADQGLTKGSVMHEAAV